MCQNNGDKGLRWKEEMAVQGSRNGDPFRSAMMAWIQNVLPLATDAQAVKLCPCTSKRNKVKLSACHYTPVNMNVEH